MERKRIRSANFTPEEKYLCLNLIDNYKKTLENKKNNNAETWKEKEEAWKKIEYEFNYLNPAKIRRTKESLKKFYENSKKSNKLIMQTKCIYEGISDRSNDFHNTPTDHSYDITSALYLKPLIDLKNEFDHDKVDSSSPEGISCCISPENIETGKDDLTTQIDININPKETELNLLPPQQCFEYDANTSHKKKKYECISPNRRHRPVSSSTALAKKYEDLATIKIKCSQIQLDILKIEKESAVLRLNKEKYDIEKRKVEDDRKQEEYENKKREDEVQTKRDEELFILRHQSLLLDIEIKKNQLQKLNSE